MILTVHLPQQGTHLLQLLDLEANQINQISIVPLSSVKVERLLMPTALPQQEKVLLEVPGKTRYKLAKNKDMEPAK
jgi:hypothetical protein